MSNQYAVIKDGGELLSFTSRKSAELHAGNVGGQVVDRWSGKYVVARDTLRRGQPDIFTPARAGELMLDVLFGPASWEECIKYWDRQL